MDNLVGYTKKKKDGDYTYYTKDGLIYRVSTSDIRVFFESKDPEYIPDVDTGIFIPTSGNLVKDLDTINSICSERATKVNNIHTYLVDVFSKIPTVLVAVYGIDKNSTIFKEPLGNRLRSLNTLIYTSDGLRIEIISIATSNSMIVKYGRSGNIERIEISLDQYKEYNLIQAVTNNILYHINNKVDDFRFRVMLLNMLNPILVESNKYDTV